MTELERIGEVVREGISSVERNERFTNQTECTTSYSTRFQGSDGRIWSIRLQPAGPRSAHTALKSTQGEQS